MEAEIRAAIPVLHGRGLLSFCCAEKSAGKCGKIYRKRESGILFRCPESGKKLFKPGVFVYNKKKCG